MLSKPFPTLQKGREGEVHILSAKAFPSLTEWEGKIHLLSGKTFQSLSLQREIEGFISHKINHFLVCREGWRNLFLIR